MNRVKPSDFKLGKGWAFVLDRIKSGTNKRCELRGEYNITDSTMIRRTEELEECCLIERREPANDGPHYYEYQLTEVGEKIIDALREAKEASEEDSDEVNETLDSYDGRVH